MTLLSLPDLGFFTNGSNAWWVGACPRFALTCVPRLRSISGDRKHRKAVTTLTQTWSQIPGSYTFILVPSHQLASPVHDINCSAPLNLGVFLWWGPDNKTHKLQFWKHCQDSLVNATTTWHGTSETLAAFCSFSLLLALNILGFTFLNIVGKMTGKEEKTSRKKKMFFPHVLGEEIKLHVTL